MYRGWFITTALLIAIYCLLVFIRKVVICKQTEYENMPELSLLFLVKNQQNTIEGLVRGVFAGAYPKPAEVVAIDLGSVDQTRLIFEYLAKEYDNFRYLACEELRVSKRVFNVCRGHIIYCFDLTSPINYNLMSKTIQSILNGSGSSLYRTKVLYKNETMGRCKHN